MRTNIEIDDELMREAMIASGAATKREAVELGLQKLVQAKRQLDAFDELWGMGWEGDLDEMRTDKPLSEWG